MGVSSPVIFRMTLAAELQNAQSPSKMKTLSIVSKRNGGVSWGGCPNYGHRRHRLKR